MPGNSFGQIFRVTTAGEGHGSGYVVIIDGVPPGLALSEEDLKPDLARRRPGQSKITTQRQEADVAEILSGVFDGKTTGTPIAIAVRNLDQRPKDYSQPGQPQPQLGATLLYKTTKRRLETSFYKRSARTRHHHPAAMTLTRRITGTEVPRAGLTSLNPTDRMRD